HEVRDQRGCGHGLSRPDQPLPVFVAGKPPEGELLTRCVQECLVAVEDMRERSIGHAALALQKRDEGRQRRVHPCPGGGFGGHARGRGGGLGEGRAAGLAEPCARADLVTASCANHGWQTTTAGEAYVGATGRSSLSGSLEAREPIPG